MKRAYVGLMVRACLAGLLVQLVVLILASSNEFSMPPVFWVIVGGYGPIIVAANMGYQEGQAAMRAKNRLQGPQDTTANPPIAEEDGSGANRGQGSSG